MTSIEWTEKTWNPVVGCSKVSLGCSHCYAERLAASSKLQKFPQYQETANEKGWTGNVVLVTHKLNEPLKRKAPTTWFVNSMSDIFHEDLPLEQIKAVFEVMNQTPRHTYQVLTKRSERLLQLASQLNWSKNIWMGVSVENQDYVYRIDHLKQVPATIRFLSCEPLLGRLELDLTEDIHWVIVGGESGRNFRPMDLDWARSIRDRCLESRVPFFFKQTGGKTPRSGSKELDGIEWKQKPLTTASQENPPLLEVVQYNWWGNKHEPPPGLRTKKQLGEMGLKPLQPVGQIDCKDYICKLYDPGNPFSSTPKKRPTEKQLAALEKTRKIQEQKRYFRWWKENAEPILTDRSNAVKWARSVLENPQDYCILDTETTGLDDTEVVEIAIINLEGETLLDTLVKPIIPILDEVIAIHGITDKMVADAPTFPEVYPQLLEILANKKEDTVLVYNLGFDRSVLNYCCDLHQLKKLGLKKKGDCLMLWYAQWYGEWSSHWNDYQWQKLNSGHRALTDCFAVLDLLKEMAADDPELEYPEGFPEERKGVDKLWI